MDRKETAIKLMQLAQFDQQGVGSISAPKTGNVATMMDADMFLAENGICEREGLDSRHGMGLIKGTYRGDDAVIMYFEKSVLETAAGMSLEMAKRRAVAGGVNVGGVA